jgi:tRNA modification GTPase
MNIYALSSGRGPSGIAIIRLSGKDALKISKLISQEKNLKSKEINLCKFYDPSNNLLIDKGLLLSFSSPNSFTGDDLVEFHIHGSNAVISCFLKVLSEQDNCRLAEPGEFTKIAFQNNKIDLIEAESIGDLIHSETELQRQQAVKLIQGNASNYYNDLRGKLIKSLAYIEAKIDFAEDDLPESVLKGVHKSIKEVSFSIKKILEDQKVGEKIRDGFRVSIVGEVNAGKSSLLNLLSKRDAAIVSEEKGTTRDIIEVYLNIDGYPVILADTAGIRDSKSEVEKKGISLAIKKSIESDLSLIMIDNSSKTIDVKIKNLINENCIVVLNKSDIEGKQNYNFNKSEVVLISVKKNNNIVQLISKIKKKLSTKFKTSNDVLVTRERHRIKLNACLKEIDNFLKKDQNKDIEIAAEDLRMATRHLGAIVGKVDVEEILGSIFKDFCIGK